MTDEELREIKQRSVISRPTALDVSRLINEIRRLKDIIQLSRFKEEACDTAWELNGDRYR
jgi:hypothetical protein